MRNGAIICLKKAIGLGSLSASAPQKLTPKGVRRYSSIGKISGHLAARSCLKELEVSDASRLGGKILSVGRWNLTGRKAIAP
jgi:hypothetical protein